jgi:hypothetical protein
VIAEAVADAELRLGERIALGDEEIVIAPIAGDVISLALNFFYEIGEERHALRDRLRFG